SLPIFGNLVQVTKVGNRPDVFPTLFQSAIRTTNKPVKELERDFHSNTFAYNPATFLGREEFIPFLTNPDLFVQLATLETGKRWIYSPDPLPPDHQILRGSPLFPLLKEMMLESDNFIAEQAMFMVSDRLFGELDTERAIEHI